MWLLDTSGLELSYADLLSTFRMYAACTVLHDGDLGRYMP